MRHQAKVGKRFLRRPFAVAVVIFCGGCGSSGPSDGAGGAGSGGTGGIGGAGGGNSGSSHPTCAGASVPNLPADFGASCGAGSNYDLCAITSTDQCAGGSCLWDAKRKEAYCTIACGDASPCPARFACTAQKCSTGPARVCVRTESASSPTCTTISTDFTLTFADAATAADGRIYAFAQKTSGATTVFSQRPSDAAWTKIFERPAFAMPSGNFGQRLATADAVYYVLWSGKLLRLVGTDVTEESYESCTGVGDCKYGGLHMFQTSGGVVRGFSVNGPVFERSAQGTWTSVMDKMPSGFRFGGPFAKSGFWGYCQAAGAPTDAAYDQLCVGSQGDDIHSASLPAGEALVDWDTAVTGQTPDDFLVFAASGNLFRRVQGAWVKEGLPAPDASAKGGELVNAINGTLYAFRDTAGPIFKLAAGASCWESISDSLYSMGIPLDNQTLGYLSTPQWCEVPLP